MTQELYKKYRPRKLKDIIGQPEAVSQLYTMLKQNTFPHAVLFAGNSGCGKTTMARIAARRLAEWDGEIDHCLDIAEINAASSRGIDTVREIESRQTSAAMGKRRVWIIDEVHQMSKRRGGDAQTALLKILEDTPSHVYFLLCTTDPNELLPTLRNRCTLIKVNPLPEADMRELLNEVLAKEGKKVTDKVLEAIVEVVEGSARQALVILHQVLGIPDEKEQLACIQAADTKKQAWDLVKALIWGKTKWSEIVTIINQLDEKDWESLRKLVLANATTSLLKGGRNVGNTYFILVAFEGSFMYSGKAGFVRACYEVMNHPDREKG